MGEWNVYILECLFMEKQHPPRNRDSKIIQQLLRSYNANIGELIRDKLIEEERSASWLAQKVGCDPSNIHKIFRKQHIHPVTLASISLILRYNFFACYYDFIENNI